jgi:hypothetical protein
MVRVLETINDVYYNAKSPAYYAGASAVFKEAKKRDNTIKKEQVMDFLQKQIAHTLHKPVRRKFTRNVTKTAGIDVDWQADLADMNSIKTFNNGNAYILVCVDVLSRYAFVEPVRNKKPASVSEAFLAILKRSKRKCWILTTDKGNEFVGKPFQEMLKKSDIMFHTATSPDVKCAIAERYMRTLKTRIWRYFTKNKTLNYIKPLQSIVKAINNSHHRTIGRAPASVNKANEKEIWAHLYKPRTEKIKILFKVGDFVRITKEKHKLSKGYQPNFTKETFIVSKFLANRHPATYKIADLKGEHLDGVFYAEELVRVSSRSKLADSVEEILETGVRNNTTWLKVKLKNGRITQLSSKDLIQA